MEIELLPQYSRVNKKFLNAKRKQLTDRKVVFEHAIGNSTWLLKFIRFGILMLICLDFYQYLDLFRFLSILLNVKSVSKKIDILPKAGCSTLALGHTFASL